MFVYVIVNSETLKLYVGQHSGNSLRKYLQTKFSDAAHGRGGKSYLYRSMRKYPQDCWSIHPLISDIETKQELDDLERHFIRALKTQHPDVGYNICGGGEGQLGNKCALGCKHSPESIRRAVLNCARNDEWKRKQSEAHQGQRGTWLGRKFSDEHLANLSDAHKGQRAWNKGITCSDDARRKNSEAHKGKIPWNKGKRSKL